MARFHLCLICVFNWVSISYTQDLSPSNLFSPVFLSLLLQKSVTFEGVQVVALKSHHLFFSPFRMQFLVFEWSLFPPNHLWSFPPPRFNTRQMSVFFIRFIFILSCILCFRTFNLFSFGFAKYVLRPVSPHSTSRDHTLLLISYAALLSLKFAHFVRQYYCTFWSFFNHTCSANVLFERRGLIDALVKLTYVSSSVGGSARWPVMVIFSQLGRWHILVNKSRIFLPSLHEGCLRFFSYRFQVSSLYGFNTTMSSS
jgi:hypothetical protein